MRFLSVRQVDGDFPVTELKARLIGDRATTKLHNVQLMFNDEEPSITRNTDNWVRTWVDLEHQVADADSSRIAYRAITESGQLIWMVETPGRKFAFHANALLPEDAFVQAEQARIARRGIAKRWNDVRVLRRQVLLGSVRLTASLEDARSAGLCELGIQGFLKKIGYAGATHVSGRLLMLISYFDRQVAYPVYMAHLRTQEESQAAASPRGVSMQ